MILCARLCVEPTEALTGQARKKRLLSLTTIVTTFEKNNFIPTSVFGCFLSQHILLYSLFCNALAVPHFSSKKNTKISGFWVDLSLRRAYKSYVNSKYAY